MDLTGEFMNLSLFLNSSAYVSEAYLRIKESSMISDFSNLVTSTHIISIQLPLKLKKQDHKAIFLSVLTFSKTL